MSTTMAISSSRTRSNSPTLYRPRKYSPTTSFSSSSPILTPSIPRSLRFSDARNRPNSPESRIHVSDERKNNKKACLCSPTTHPGSYRCSKHKNQPRGGGGNLSKHRTASFPAGLNMRRSAMANSLVRIGVVEGDFVKRSLSSLTRPSPNEPRPRADFQRRPSRLSVMSRAAESS